MTKRVFNLTGGALPVFVWRLPHEIAAYKQTRFPASQWINVIKGFSQKGIKTAEIEDSQVLPWLEDQGANQVTKEEIAEFVSYSLPAIKEARLLGGDVQYRGYAWVEGSQDYNESLFYFPTITEDFSDRIADLDEAISALNFDFDKLGQDPDLVFRLDEKREQLIAKQKNIVKGGDGPGTHFASKLQNICPDARADFAHMRWSVLNLNGEKTLFVHEFQSDWAQKGRKNDWKGDYKKAPLVTETEYWTSFLMRRAMTLAVENGCGQLTWINGAKMANGGVIQGSPGLDEFYLKIVTGIAKRLAKPFNAELALKDFALKGQSHRLAVMPVTDSMREKYGHRAPVYSYAKVVEKASFDPVRAEQLRRALQLHADKMFGKEHVMRVKIVKEILNACDSHQPAAALVGRVADVAFNAADPVKELAHEGFHFACRYLFTSKDMNAVNRAFAPGSPLLARTVRILLARGELAAAEQAAASQEEAAAHAFALWKRGQMSLPKVSSLAPNGESRRGITEMLTRIFPAAEQFIQSTCAWMRGSVSPTDFVARIVRAHGEVNGDSVQDTRPASTEQDEVMLEQVHN